MSNRLQSVRHQADEQHFCRGLSSGRHGRPCARGGAGHQDPYAVGRCKLATSVLWHMTRAALGPRGTFDPRASSCVDIMGMCGADMSSPEENAYLHRQIKPERFDDSRTWRRGWPRLSSVTSYPLATAIPRRRLAVRTAHTK